MLRVCSKWNLSRSHSVVVPLQTVRDIVFKSRLLCDSIEQVKMNCILTLSLVIVNIARVTIGQETGFECCGIYMMDTRGMVVIETRRQLSNGTFVALKVRACSTAPVAVQIWRRIDDYTFKFRWQTVISPIMNPMTRTFITINFNSTPLVITSDDRLGLFSPANSSNLTIPYGFNDTLYYLYYTTTSFNSFNDFLTAPQVTMDDLRWPRSFGGSVFFCRATGCSDVAPDIGSQGSSFTTPSSSSVTPAGQCCANPIVCDTSGIDGRMGNQTAEVQNLNIQINEILEMIKTLTTNRVTGTCPTGFTPGSYGVGKCYLAIRDQVSMAVAALRCQTEYNSILVQIQNILEDSFLRTWLSNSAPSGSQTFWTAGMFNLGSKSWYWYDESSRTKTPMVYMDWQSNIQPTPTSDSDICVKLTVAQGSGNSSYWNNGQCEEPNFFICQVYKICL